MPYDFTTWDRNTTEEQATPIGGAVSGTIPQWLRGSFILNGPGRMKFGDQEYNHLFDGAALLQKFQFTETGPQYSSKFIRSNTYEINMESQQIVVSEFGTKGSGEVKKGIMKKIGNTFTLDMKTDNAPLNLVYYGKKVYANSEAPTLTNIDPVNLDTKEKIDLMKEIGVIVQCPHPLKMPDGVTLALFTAAGATGPKHEIYSIPSGAEKVFSKSNKMATVDARWKLNPCHVHSFAATQNHVIIPEQPFTMDVKALIANTVMEKPFIEGMEWLKDKLVKLRVVSRETGKEIKLKYKTDPFFYLHVVNAYEDSGHIVVDMLTFKQPDIIYMGFLKKLREEMSKLYETLDPGRLVRLVLPVNPKEKTTPVENLVTLKGSKATAYRQKDGVILLKPEIVTEICYENPVINLNQTGLKYNYFYGASGDLEGTFGKVGKVNMANGEVKEWYKNDLYACALAYVPRPGAQAEDDGAVLVICLHGGNVRSKVSVAVLEASTMNELAIVEYTVPGEAIRAIHGIYIAE